MIDAREAASRAANYLKDLFPEAQGMQLEEVEISDDDSEWSITLSFFDPEKISLPLNPPPKKYKIFRIDAETAEVRSMKIRKV
jgi:hypothetical protein